MDRSDLQERTFRFAVDVTRLCSRLPNEMTYWVVGKQLVRCATSVGANYRSACRAKSRADFIAKLAIVEEEADESMYWLEILKELNPELDSKRVEQLHNEANQLVAITVASKRTARRNHS